MTNLTNNDALFITFKNAIAQYLIKRGMLSSMPSSPDSEPAVTAAYTAWMAEGNNPQQIVDDVAASILKFQAWAEFWTYQPEPLHLMSMTVSYAIPTKVGAATFSLQFEIPNGTPATPDALSALQVQAYDLLKQSYQRTAARRSLVGVAPNAPAADKAMGLPEIGEPLGEYSKVTAIYVAKERGKMVVKVKGGKYSEYGANCYIEVYEPAFAEIGLSLDDFKHGEDTPMSGTMRVLRGDRAEKVVALTLTKPK